MLEPAPDPAEPEIDPLVVRSTLGFPVVGIGASAGGITALQRVLDGMPAQIGMAFVVVVHLSPTHDSALSEILQRHTRMPVSQVHARVAIACDHVYVIPPSKQLTMTDGHLVTADLVHSDGAPTSIDLFFRSLAVAHRERAVAIVLSGTGTDGTQGLKRVRELGGVTMAQLPDDAEHDGMPRSAIATGLVDIVLPAVDMGQHLLDFWKNASQIALPAPPDDLMSAPVAPGQLEAAEDALNAIRALLRERTTHDFTHYKRATVMRRIERRMQVTRVSTLPDYLRVLGSDPAEPHALLQDMLISVTNFFRDRLAFEALERELMTASPARHGSPFRAWVVGCATGEEAYSIAMLLDEHLDTATDRRPVQVFASDIDQRAIHIGRAGLYPSSIITDVTPTRLRQYFTNEQGQYRIAKSVRENVVFSAHNALRDPPFSQIDLICCRNLLIYLDRVAQAKLLQTFHFALNPGGVLFLGSSESVDVAPELYIPVDKRLRIYRPSGPRTPVKTLLPALSALPLGAPSFFAQPARVPQKLPQNLPYQQVMMTHVPAVLINADGQVLHVNDGASQLLRMAGGQPTTKLLALIRPELRTALRGALFRAGELGCHVRSASVDCTIDGRRQHISIDVRPFDDPSLGPCRLVLLNTADATLATDLPLTDSANPTVLALEAELDRANTLLSGSLGESANATEELRSMNEELRSMNEELRSATEELETGKEELQSLNEELITANQELKNNIEETAKTNDDLSNLVASMDIGTVFVDRALRIKRYTPRATMLFNLIPSDIGRPLLDITHRLNYPALAADLSKVMTALRPSEREVQSTDGSHHLVRMLPYRTREDYIDGTVINIIDVSALRSAEHKLRRNEHRMRMVADSMRDFAIVTFDPDGTIATWNSGAQIIFGHTAEEAIGRPGEMLFTPEDRAEGVPAKEFGRAREAGRAEDERWHLRKGGQRFYASGIMSPMVDGGELLGYAKIARDLTESKLQETQRDASLDAAEAVRAKLEDASRMKDEFLAVMSHELKNPLNLIQMNAEMLLRIPQASTVPMVARAAKIIRQSVSSQAQIIDDLLDLSRLNTGKFGLNVGPVPLRPIVQRIVGAARAGSPAQRQTITEDVQDLVLDADPVRVEQILWNLVSNAQKFTPDGGSIEITAAADGDRVVLRVTDTGEGMEQPFLSEVFEMFRQADAGISRQRGGLGIGLALVRRLAELHGGTATATSAGRGRGSTFCVTLPLHQGDDPETRPPPASAICAGMRVLLVEDDAEALDMFSQLLRLEGAEVVPVNNGAEAIERAAAAGFDVIISDLSMPGMDGYTLGARLRALPNHAHTVLVALSGMARPDDQKRALDAGFDAHFAKPVEVDRMLDTLRSLLSARQRGQDATSS